MPPTFACFVWDKLQVWAIHNVELKILGFYVPKLQYDHNDEQH